VKLDHKDLMDFREHKDMVGITEHKASLVYRVLRD
jgi:hypothetical protein